MKFLHIIILQTISVGYVVATTFINTGLAEKIGRGDFEIIKGLSKEDWKLRNEATEYVISKDDPDLISNFLEQTTRVDQFILIKLYKGASPATINKVIGKVNFTRDHLVKAASDPDLVCLPTKFIDILGKIHEPEYLEHVIRTGVNNLFHEKRTDCIDGLLTALNDKKFRDKRLKDLALQEIFKGAASRFKKDLTERFYDHPAITPEVYASGLSMAWKCGSNSQDPVFYWMLEEADKDDLLACQKRGNYTSRHAEFRTAIEGAFFVAEPGGSRPSTREKAAFAKKVVSEITNTQLKNGFVNIIGSYMIDDYEEE